MKGLVSRRRLSTAVAGVSLVLTAATARGEDRVVARAVAVEGGVAAGTSDGSTYGHIATTAQITADGVVGFNAHLVPPGADPYASYVQTTWAGVPSALQLLARPGDAVPGKPAGTTFTTVGLAVLTADGRAVMSTGVTGTSGMIWAGGNGGGLTPLVEAGTQAPGMPAGVTLSSTGGLVYNAGLVGFNAYLSGTGVDLLNRNAFFIGQPGTIVPVARTGSPAPGYADGVTLGNQPIGAVNPMNAKGQMLFITNVTGPGMDASNNQALYLGSPGGLQLIGGAPAPDPMKPNFSIGNPALNNAGQLAYSWKRTLQGSDLAIFDAAVVTGTPGNLMTIAHTGWAAPGLAGQRMKAFSDPLINSAGRVAFGARTEDIYGSAAGAVYVASADGVLTPKAWGGEQAPGAPAGTVLMLPGNPLAFNNRDQVVFAGLLAGTGVDATNDYGIWATVGNGIVQLARRGDSMDLGGGRSGTFYSYPFATRGGNGEDGYGLVLNDLGQVALTLQFMEAGKMKNGVFLFTLPSAVPGDADNDLSVSIADFARLQAGFGKAGDRLGGDFNYDGVVDGQDFSILYGHFGQSFGGPSVPMSDADRGTLEGFAAAHGISVPEPGGLAGALLGGLLLGRRRRRRRARR